MAGKEKKPHIKLYAEIATTRDGRDITRGYVDDTWYLQPQDEVLRYKGGANYKIYEDLLRDDRVKSVLSQRRDAVVAHETIVTPASNMRRDKAAAAFIEEALQHIRWDTVTEKMLYGLHYGYSVAEALYARDGAHVMLDAVHVRNRRRFVFDPLFRPLLLTSDKPDGELLPEKKFWVFSVGADNDDEPYGRGLGHYLYWPVWFKKNGLKFWSTFLDKFGSPTAVGRYNPATADEAAVNKLRQALQSIHTDSAIAMPDSMMVELLEASRAGRVDYDGFYGRMNDAITTVVLSQTMTTSDGASLSQAEVHMDVRDEVVEGDSRLVCDSFNRQIVTWLTEWNFPGATPPRVTRNTARPESLKTLAERDKLIVDMGHALTADYIERTYGVEIDPTAPPRPQPGNPPAPGTEFAEDDPVLSTLANQARADTGPKFDALIARAQAALADAGDLTGWRDWLDTEGVAALDTAPVTDALAAAMAATFLTGWSDAEDNSASGTAFAEGPARQPFDEQITFFRNKLNLPTASWTDIWQGQHDKAFVVAGAAKAELLTDLRGAVDGAIAEGETLAKFRKRFDAIVDKHGWSYNGGRDWRTRVIYDTNLRTSYAAGRYEQMQAVKELRPYWRYRHSHASEEPRAEHLEWDGTVLDADDPWWDAHYPPNGWGCKCYVETLSERDLKDLGKTGPDKAPKVTQREVTVGTRGPNPRTVNVPDGIAPGFAYAPGAGNIVRHRLDRSLSQPVDIASRSVSELLNNGRLLQSLSDDWAKWHRRQVPRGSQAEAFVIGALSPPVVKALATLGAKPATAAVTITRRELDHQGRRAKADRGAALNEADLDRLVENIAAPEAVLRDTEAPHSLLYIFTPQAGKGKGKVVVRMDYSSKLQLEGQPREMITSNSVRTAGYVELDNLREARYELLEGALEE